MPDSHIFCQWETQKRYMYCKEKLDSKFYTEGRFYLYRYLWVEKFVSVALLTSPNISQVWSVVLVTTPSCDVVLQMCIEKCSTARDGDWGSRLLISQPAAPVASFCFKMCECSSLVKGFCFFVVFLHLLLLLEMRTFGSKWNPCFHNHNGDFPLIINHRCCRRVEMCFNTVLRALCEHFQYLLIKLLASKSFYTTCLVLMTSVGSRHSAAMWHPQSRFGPSSTLFHAFHQVLSDLVIFLWFYY